MSDTSSTAAVEVPGGLDPERAKIWGDLKPDGKGLVKVPWRVPHDYHCREDRPMVLTLLRFMMWVIRGECMILDRDRLGLPIPLKPRVGQWRLWEAMLEQACAGDPIRVVVPKYRRHGISTAVQALFYFIVTHVPYRNCRTTAHSEDAAKEIFQIARIMHEQRGFKETKGNENQKKIAPPGMNSTYQCFSGVANFAASGSTVHCLHVSEVAKFPNSSAQDRRALMSMLNAVPQTSPDSIIVLESSGQGPEGVFPERCRAAFEGRGNYKCVFLPWLLDPELREDEDGLPEEWDPPLSGDEIILKERHGATDGQLAWRRTTLENNFPEVPFGETPPAFGWDFPTTLEECFGQKSGRIYPDFQRFKHVSYLDVNKLSSQAYRTRFIDWGSGGDHPAVCLWALVDPTMAPQLTVSPDCVHFISEHLKYSRNPKTGERNKSDDHTCDAARIGIATFRIEGLIYFYQELYVTDHSECLPSRFARRIHLMSGWHHETGDDGHPDLGGFVRGEEGQEFRWGGPENAKPTDAEGRPMEAGVADRARGDLIRQFCEWGIPLIGHIRPSTSNNSKGEVEDGFAMVNTLMAGDVLFRSPVKNVERDLALTAMEKLRRSRMVMPTEAELEALGEEMRETRLVSTPNGPSRQLTFTAWADVD